MQDLIMLGTVLFLAAADFLTGIIKAYLKNDLSCAVMRRGGLCKLCELTVTAAACGLERSIAFLERTGGHPLVRAAAGTFTAGLVFAYIVLMELISILENFGGIMPDAAWVHGLIRRLRAIERKESEGNVSSETDRPRRK